MSVWSLRHRRVKLGVVNMTSRVDEWLTEMRTYEEHLVTELRRVRHLLQAADNPDARAGSSNTTEMVLDLFKENPQDSFTAAEVESEIRSRGWVTDSNDPVNAVRAALNRLKNNNEIELVSSGRGRYTLLVNDPWGPAPESSGPVDDEPPF